MKRLTVVLLTVCLLVAAWQAQQGAASDEGIVIDAHLPVEQQRAADLAAANAQVQEYLAGGRAELFGVLDLPWYDGRRCDGCQQVVIYDYTRNASVHAIVINNRIDAVLYQPQSQPGYNDRIEEMARELILASEQVQAALGRQPVADELALMQIVDERTEGCNGRHYCIATTFVVDSGLLWVLVDVKQERIGRIWWTSARPRAVTTTLERSVPLECGDVQSHTQGNWSFDFYITPSDGLAVVNASYDGQLIAKSLKLVEWHADYEDATGAFGYRDLVGCGGVSPIYGFPIAPYGATQISNIRQSDTIIGFELRQDYRQSSWGDPCKYRYEQRYQFFYDGSWRPIALAYGNGCGDAYDDEATYWPILRIDLDLAGAANDSFDVWTASGWSPQSVEMWDQHDAPYLNAIKYRVYDTGGVGFAIEPGQGQFGDDGRHDNAYIYVTQYDVNEGEADMALIGGTSATDEKRGPHKFIDGESIDDENIVLWYVPQATTITDAYGSATGQDPYCWSTSTTDPNQWYPCRLGPLFVPMALIPTAVTLQQAGGGSAQPLLVIVVAALALLLGSFVAYRRRDARLR